MISLEGAKHAVAAAYDSKGLSFFDPNAGIMTCAGDLVGDSASKKMTKALTWFFSHAPYAKPPDPAVTDPAVKLIATKYKPGTAGTSRFRRANFDE